MRTRSSARNLFPPLDNPELTIQRRSRADPTFMNDFEMATKGNGDPPVSDLRNMEELCQPSLNGRGGTFIKVNGVTDDALCLYHFPRSLTHHATAWFDRLSRNSINTFEQMAKMFLGKYFPPSMVTKLRNEITNFRQCLDESLFEAWERYKLSIDQHRDTINVAASGTFMKRRLEECYDLTENMTAHHNDWDTSAQRSESSSSITSSFDQEIVALKAPPLAKPRTYMLWEPIEVMNTASSSGLGTLLSNTITNPKEDLKGITTRSGTAYQGHMILTISSSLPQVVERETEVAKDTVPPTNNGSTKDVQPPVVQVETSKPNSEPVIAPIIEAIVAPISALKPNQKPSIPICLEFMIITPR
nr:hypothetical protein [Tanacetum cinerariifolium]